jgi:hypothetical protein
VADVRSDLFIIGARLHPEVSNIPELLGSNSSRVLSLAYARVYYYCFFGSEVVEVVRFPSF